ncbi:Uncharacterized protein TCM_023339 [Theobroma cacao]|uniref:Uncharacterized protein n=1 Tax=Theobroma cacao TaxID=3641 RepID=A0A061EW05_THECC|nr:Uncharacterized protein TCM_023339 [Theobroma cacao]
MNMRQLNVKVMHTLHCTLDDNDYKRVSKCESAKEIWKKLEELYRETKKEKELEEKLYESQCSTCAKAIRDEESIEIQSSIQFESWLMALKELKEESLPIKARKSYPTNSDRGT